MGNKLLYDGYLLPVLPTWDETTYPYAFITIRSDLTKLWVFSVPIYRYKDSDGRTVTGTKPGESHYCGSYKLSSDGSSWGSFVQNDALSTAENSEMGWVNHDIMNLDTGCVYKRVSTIVSPDGLFCEYNGVKLPMLPYWDMRRLPYAFIYRNKEDNINDSSFYVFISDTPLHYKGGTAVYAEDGKNECYATASLKYGRGVEFGKFLISDNKFGNVFSTWNMGHSIAKPYLIWSNYDIYDTSTQELVLASSFPKLLSTGKEVEWYYTHKFRPHPDSMLKGIELGKRLKSRGVTQVSNIGDGISHSKTIPDGGTYYIGVTSYKTGDYTGATSILGAGESFPETFTNSDVYVYGDYEYRYNRSFGTDILSSRWIVLSGQKGWGARVLDSTKESYEDALTSINGENVTSFYNTFRGCTALIKSPNIPKWVTIMDKTFYGCSSLVDVSDLVIPSGVTSLTYTFYNCTSLTISPDLSKNFMVNSLNSAFNGCAALEVVSSLPPNVTSLASTFAKCTSLTVAPNLPNSVRDMASTFSGCSSLVDVPNIPSEVVKLYETFSGCVGLVETPDLGGAIKVNTIHYTFRGCTSLKVVNPLPPNLISMPYTFSECTSLEYVDLSGLKKLTYMEYTFYGCTSLTDTLLPDNVEVMLSTFSSCSALTEMPKLPIKLKKMSSTFRGCGLVDLSDLKIPKNVVSMSSAFQECASLRKPPVIPDNVEDIGYLFQDCTSLEYIPEIHSDIKDMDGIFKGCVSLTDVTGLVIPEHITDFYGMFDGCTNLTGTIRINIEQNLDGTGKDYCFRNTTKPITLIGTGTEINTKVLNLLVGTATNGNVTIAT